MAEEGQTPLYIEFDVQVELRGIQSSWDGSTVMTQLKRGEKG